MTEWKDNWNDGRIFVYEDGEIVIWCKEKPEGKVDSAWIQKGLTAVTIPYEAPFADTLVFCKHLVADNLVTCCHCGKIGTRDEMGGSHFAGYFCDTCWEDYKKKNSRRCGICGSPLWNCCC